MDSFTSRATIKLSAAPFKIRLLVASTDQSFFYSIRKGLGFPQTY
jgi:hypothetical protein